MTIIDGKLISMQIKDETKLIVDKLKSHKIEPKLAVILVGEDASSSTYVKNKEIACEYTGIHSISYKLSKNTSEPYVINLIEELNNDSSVHGILVQLPLPSHISEGNILPAINPQKDVDGFHPYNSGLFYTDESILKPCTPSGIIELLNRYKISIPGKNCVVVGRSNIVGRPTAELLLQNDGTVTICHSKTKNLEEICANADILVSAIGKPKFITANMVKENSVVIDVGICRDEFNKLCGDVDFENVKNKVSYITPVPGGVGPMTIAMLMKNCVLACMHQTKKFY